MNSVSGLRPPLYRCHKITGLVSYNPWFEGSELPGPPQAAPLESFPQVGQSVPLAHAAPTTPFPQSVQSEALSQPVPTAPLAFNTASDPNVPMGIGFTPATDPTVKSYFARCVSVFVS